MPINILMPALSPTMEKGNLAKWLKKEGEKVKPGDVIAEIETDKATMEVEAVDEGTLAKIVVPEGTADVPVNQLIAVLAGEGEDTKAAGASAASAAPAPKPGAASSFETRAAGARQDEAEKRDVPAAPTKPAPRPEEAAPAAVSKDGTTSNGHGRIVSSPLARPQALGQRLRREGARGGAAEDPERERELDRKRHAQAQAFRRGRRGRAAGRADHADRAQRGDEIALHDLERAERHGRARACAKAQAAGISGRQHRGLEPRHVRHQRLHRGDQSAARDDPRGRRRRGA